LVSEVIHFARSATCQATLVGQALGLLGSVTALAGVALQLAADGAAVSPHQLRHFRVRLSLLPQSEWELSLLKRKMFSHRWASVRTSLHEQPRHSNDPAILSPISVLNTVAFEV
jgi:hypothetical protein